ncbi:fatty acid desaturase [Nonomuraea typhae]|uniref:Fatty acid desaturase n=1 Tax=Nonomuraea typhae TaxID=2603600 RepID=A0ABW7Z8J8_9ACTN
MTKSSITSQTEERSPIDFDRLSPDVRKRVSRLTKLDNWHGLLGVLQEYAIIAAAVYLCVGVSWWFYPLSALLIGSSHRALAHFLHESAHRVLAGNSTINLVLGTYFSGYLTFQMYNPYRNTHVGCHHRNLGDPETDPDYSFHQECGLYDYHQSDATFMFKNVVAAVVGLRTVSYVRYLLRDRIFCTMPRLVVSMPIKFRRERWLLLTQWALILGLCAYAGWLHVLVLLWFVPMVTTGIAVGWLSELAEHYPLPESESKKLLLTRNRHGWAVENFLLGRYNDRYHLIHHLNPGIPFWNLRKAHRVLREDPGYSAWDDLWAGILTRPRSRRHGETVLTYGAKYRAWRRAGGDPRAEGTSFAEVMARADRARAVTR